MTDIEALKTLREKVAAGTAMEGDFIVFVKFGVPNYPANNTSAITWSIQAYRGSLDAAVALLEAVKPGAAWAIDWSGWANVETAAGLFEVTADTPARALLLANIDALIEEAEDE